MYVSAQNNAQIIFDNSLKLTILGFGLNRAILETFALFQMRYDIIYSRYGVNTLMVVGCFSLRAVYANEGNIVTNIFVCILVF